MDVLASIVHGSTSVLIQVFIQNTSAPGTQGLTALTAATAGLAAYYRVQGSAAGGVSISLTAGTRGTWASGSFVEIDSAAMPGWYELGLPNAMLASGGGAGSAVDLCFPGQIVTNMGQVNVKIPLT